MDGIDADTLDAMRKAKAERHTAARARIRHENAAQLNRQCAIDASDTTAEEMLPQGGGDADDSTRTVNYRTVLGGFEMIDDGRSWIGRACAWGQVKQFVNTGESMQRHSEPPMDSLRLGSAVCLRCAMEYNVDSRSGSDAESFAVGKIGSSWSRPGFSRSCIRRRRTIIPAVANAKTSDNAATTRAHSSFSCRDMTMR